MTINQIFNIQTVFSLFLFSLVVVWYVWPKLKTQKYYDMLTVLLVYSAFRYLGTSFAALSMTAGLTPEFGRIGAPADIILSLIAIVGAIALRKGKSWGLFFAWIYTIFGSLDFIYNGVVAGPLQVVEHIGPLMWLMTVLGPTWMITLVVLWRLLIKPVNKPMTV
jgi:hypothetical protein